MKGCGLIVFALSFFLAAPPVLHAVEPDEVAVVRLSPQDGSAVIRTADGELSVVRLGDLVGEIGRITEITGERLMLERPTAQGMERIIIRLIEGQQTVEVLTPRGLRERGGAAGPSDRR